LIVLRMGAEGALIAEGQTGSAVQIPALPASTLVDPVGAGDAYCGGFIAGWLDRHDIAAAGLYGAVAASFAIEQIGLPPITGELRAEARSRMAALEPMVESTSI
jgi:sugar/nucleoside kinase (ribokinase family)